MLDVTPKNQKSRTQALTGRPRVQPTRIWPIAEITNTFKSPRAIKVTGRQARFEKAWPRMGRKGRLRQGTPLHQTPCHVDQTGLYTARPRLFPSRSDLFCIRMCLFSSTGARCKAGIKRNDDNLWRALRWTRLKTQSSWTAPTSWTNHEQI